MPQLPDISYSPVGIAQPDPSRQIATADLTQKAQAIGNFGNTLSTVAQNQLDQQNQVGTAFATSHLLNQTIEAQKAAELESDPVKANAMYAQAKQQALQEAATQIPGGQARTMFLASAGEHTRNIDMAFGQNQVNKQQNIAIGNTAQLAQTNMTNALNAPNEAAASALIDNTNDLYHTLILTAPTKFTPLDELNARNQWVNNYVKAKVNSSLDNGDIQTANQVYATNKDKLPGQDQLEIEKMLHTANLGQFATNGVASLKAGQAPAPLGGQGVQDVKDAVVTAAKSAGADPNTALTIASIESSFGQNVGVRGDIGQTGKPAANTQEQAKNLVDEQLKAKQAADSALGRPAQPWEQYVAYQQGVGGGPALLTADPNQKAVDVLAPFYKNSAVAAKAITGNGGNTSMTAGQFLDFINRNYDAHAARVAVGIPDSVSATNLGTTPDSSEQVSPAVQAADQAATPGAPQAGTAAKSPPDKTILALQPGATPVQSLIEYDKVYPQYLQYANSIQNPMERDAMLKGLERDHNVYQTAANAWKTQFQNQAQNLAMDPKFTSVNQIPADMKAALADNPVTMNYLETRAKYNLENGAGMQSKDSREYGTGFYKLFQGIHAPDNDPNKINTVEQIQSHVGDSGDITVAGYDKLLSEMTNKKTPEGASEGVMGAASLKVLKTQLSGEDMYPGMKDPKGEELYASALPAYFKAIEDGKKNGTPLGDLLNPSSKSWAGNAVQGLKRNPSQWYTDMASANLGPESAPAQPMNNGGEDATMRFFTGIQPQQSGENAQVKTQLQGDLDKGKLGLPSIQNAYRQGQISRQTALDMIIKAGHGRPKPQPQTVPLAE